MTKTLTEQWRDGELFGFYYVKEPKEEPKIHNVSEMDYLLDEYGVEVLAPVPRYDKIKRLQEQLKEANEVIKYYATADLSDWEYIDGEEVFVEKGAANEKETAENYLKKWGVE